MTEPTEIKSLTELQRPNIKGKVMVLIHWDVCNPCKKYVPLYESMVKSHKGGIKFYSLGISRNNSLKDDEREAIIEKKNGGSMTVPMVIVMENGKYVSHLEPDVYKKETDKSKTVKQLEDYVSETAK